MPCRNSAVNTIILHKDPSHVKDKSNVPTDSRTVNDQHAPIEDNAQSHVLSNTLWNSSFLKLIPVVLKKKIKISALLDADSDATLISLTIADKLNADGIKQNLGIWNAVLNKKPIDSKLVTFKTLINLINWSISQLYQFIMRNIWVVLGLSEKYQKYNPDHLKSNFSHLNDIPVQRIYPGDVTLIMRTEFSHLLLLWGHNFQTFYWTKNPVKWEKLIRTQKHT